MDIRHAGPIDQPVIDALVAAAFKEESDGHVVKMVHALNGSGATRLSLVAVEDRIVGHAQLSKSWIDARQGLVEVLTLTPLSVDPARQRQGIGARLLSTALAEAEAMGMPAVFLEGDPGYYSRRGFVAASSENLARPSSRIPEQAFQVALLPAYEGWMAGQVVLCDALWESDAVGLRDPVLANVEAAFQSGAAG